MQRMSSSQRRQLATQKFCPLWTSRTLPTSATKRHFSEKKSLKIRYYKMCRKIAGNKNASKSGSWRILNSRFLLNWQILYATSRGHLTSIFKLDRVLTHKITFSGNWEVATMKNRLSRFKTANFFYKIQLWLLRSHKPFPWMSIA